MIHGYQDEGRVSLGAFVSPTLKADLVELAYLERRSLSALIREALVEKLDHAKEPAKERAPA